MIQNTKEVALKHKAEHSSLGSIFLENVLMRNTQTSYSGIDAQPQEYRSFSLQNSLFSEIFSSDTTLLMVISTGGSPLPLSTYHFVTLFIVGLVSSHSIYYTFFVLL